MCKTCLIASHDPWFIQLLKIYSEECGFQVVQAFDGQDVVNKVMHEQPAVILIHLDLPGPFNSREVLRILRRNASTSRTPILVFSWQGLEDEVVEGATAHLIEPVTYEAFVDALLKAGLDGIRAENPSHMLAPGSFQRPGSTQHRRIRK